MTLIQFYFSLVQVYQQNWCYLIVNVFTIICLTFQKETFIPFHVFKDDHLPTQKSAFQTWLPQVSLAAALSDILFINLH